ncbi:MAG: transcriptional regulator, Crp/Fnr family [Flaviaesturariibacter sp.]|nr:transcriptional regulator, Crp/Fnr family [Flaviaesturariibacter sp.]
MTAATIHALNTTMKKILLIEDNDDLRENTAEILVLSGYEVATAANGKEGVAKALAGTPDLILCDIMMPEVDGYAVLHMLHKNQALKEIPFIFLSAKAERADFRKGMELGADDYLTKPFSANELLTAIETRLNKSHTGLTETENITGEDNELRRSFLSYLKGEMIAQDRISESYKKNQVVYNEGNRPQYLFYVQKGKVKAAKQNEQGKELMIALYSEGDFFGYIPLIEGGSYKEKTITLEDAEIALIPKTEFEALLNNKDISSKFMTLLAKTVADKDQQLLNIAYNSLREKVATALLLLHKKTSKNSNEETLLHFSRETMAAIAGTATESLTRTLSDFKLEKVIDIKDSSIIILNHIKLASIAHT